MLQQALTILIVDDSQTDRETYRRFLQRCEDVAYTILEAELGQAGLDLCQQAKPDIILLDYLLPDMDGLEFLNSLKAQMQETTPPLITITGQGDEAIAVQIIKAGSDDYLIKGQITPASLQFSIEQAYEKAQLRAKLRQSEERLKLALEAAQMGTWEWQFPGERLFCSSQVSPLFGLPPGVTLPNYQAFFEQVHPSDRGKILQAVRQAFRDNLPCEVEFRVIWADGSEHWLNGKGQFYFASDRLSGRMLGTITDVTRSKQVEVERYQVLQSERLVMQIAQSVRQSLSLEEILQATVTEVRQFLQTDRVVIFQLRTSDSGVVVAESVCSEWLSVLGADFHDPCLASSYTDLYRQGRVRAITNIDNSDLEPCHVELLASLQVKANLVVPILQNATLWGLLIAHHCTAPRQWQGLEVNLLQQLSTQVSLALQQAELYRQAQMEIQQRQQTEQNLRQSEERFRLLSAFAPIGIFQTDANGCCLYTNAKWQAIAGITLEESLGEGWSNAVHPDDRKRVFGEWNRCVQMGNLFDMEFRFLTPQGKVHWVQANAAPMQLPTRQLLGYVGTNQDITERKQAEVELQAALQKLSFHVENSPLAVIEWDSQMRVARWSAAAEQMFGWQAEEVLGKQHTDWQFVCAEDLPKVRAALDQIFSSEEQQFYSCNRNYVKDGSVIHCEWYNSTMTDETGQFVSMLSLVLNISDRIQLETEREQILQLEQTARADAERANRIKDDFLAILSHELRSPLNPILGWAKLLQTRQLSAAKTAEGLAIIERNAKLQAQLIDDLLDVSRILRGKLSLTLAPVDLSATTAAAIDTVQAAATTKSIQICPILPQIGVVLGDATRIQQIVWNLLSNAIKFTPNGGRIDIRLDRVGDIAQVTVADTGKGIKPEFLPYLFESFRQEDVSVTRKHGGLGLGLAIVRHLVEAHEGAIAAESPGEGRGATFTIKLPLLSTQISDDFSNPVPEETLDLTGIRVLAIDDEDDSRRIVAVSLQQYGAIVMTVSSSAEFISALALFQPDILVSDIGMPSMDGYSLLRQVRKLPPERGGQTPAIALTAYAGEVGERQALAAGFQIHLAKPIEPEKLVKAILALQKQRV